MIKLRKFLFTLILLLSFFSCFNNRLEKKILGSWYDYNESIKLDFNRDSLVIYDSQIQNTNWKINNNHIQYLYRLPFSDSITEVSLKYEFINDTLLIVKSDFDSSKVLRLYKSKSYLDFLFHKNKIAIDLSEDENAFTQNKRNIYGVKIFIGYKNNSLIAKTEFSDDLNNLKEDIKKKVNEVSHIYDDNYRYIYKFEQWKKMVLHYSVFVDKKVPKDNLQFFLNKLRRSEIKNIYRVYKSKEEYLVPFYNLKEIKL